MSREEGLTWGKLATIVFGFILFTLGLMLTYFSINTDIELVTPRVFTPVGLSIVLIGGFMIVTRGG
ncbi:MAG: hypothetical protein ACETVY_00825 [Candidatus Bathyarchaeia archaeon]